jgi:hypothetical protein
MPIYKYFTAEAHARSFLRKGTMLFRPLSYFRAIEDGEIRGDPHDGTLTYAPSNGLEIMKEDGTKVVLEGWHFASSAKHEDIFVYCASNLLSAELATKFESPFCVEIFDPEAIVARLKRRAHASSQLDYKQTIHSRVDYREIGRAPAADWALPDKLAFIKPARFSWQDEYRIVIGRRGAMEVQNVAVTLQSGSATTTSGQPFQSALKLEIGSLAEFAQLHRF